MKALRVEKDEPAWTQWLAHLLDMRDRPSGQLTWRALCSTVEQELRKHPIIPSSSRLADAQIWESARRMAPTKVVPERPTDDGYIDVWVELPGMRIALENKLWESWHDSGKKPQAKKYHDFALEAAPDESHVGLVFLSAEPATKAEQRHGWVFITWAQFARAIRCELLSALGHESRNPLSADEALGFVPVVLTLSAIESALLGLRRDLINEHQLKWHHLEPLIALKRYLEESR